MLTFSPTEEQEEIRQLAHSVAAEQFRQQGRRSEKDGDISPTLAQTLAQTGLATPFPEESPMRWKRTTSDEKGVE